MNKILHKYLNLQIPNSSVHLRSSEIKANQGISIPAPKPYPNTDSEISTPPNGDKSIEYVQIPACAYKKGLISFLLGLKL